MNLHNFTRGAALNDYVARQYLAPLSDDQIRATAPSVFAERPHESRSARYAYIPTFRVLEALRREGFVPVKAQQSVARIEGRKTFTKHMLTFAHTSAKAARVGDSIPQISLVNSHDGTSAYRLFAGLHRFVCSNGLMVCDGEFDSISVAHTGDVRGRVIEGSFEVIDQAAKAGERALEWQGIQLAQPEQEAFARAALALRFEDREDGKAPIVEADALRARRYDDQGNDLWTVFNRVQENVVRGGQRYRQNGRRMSTREVKGIDQANGLNRALWRLADEMRAIKAAN
jgi:hypothetical protein